MVRTQIQLTEKQATALKHMAKRQSVSMAEMVRRGIECLDHIEQSENHETVVHRALAAVGKFRSRHHRLSRQHDSVFGEGG